MIPKNQQHSRNRNVSMTTPNPLNRRSAIKRLVGGVLGSGLAATAGSAPASPTPRATIAINPYSPWQPIWKLQRDKPALPNSYFWTWDHSTNWMLDDPGNLNFGCHNRYLKQPNTFLEDYRRLIDHAAGLGVKGVVIWGFLRDSHGGIEYARQVADYAAARNVALKPGVGTNSYGGIYYEGDHLYNIQNVLRQHPGANLTAANGRPHSRGICPTHPAFVDWLQEGMQWLFREFNLGGANLENGDFLVCHCARCRERLADWPKDEPAFWRYQ